MRTSLLEPRADPDRTNLPVDFWRTALSRETSARHLQPPQNLALNRPSTRVFHSKTPAFKPDQTISSRGVGLPKILQIQSSPP
jgi:hypothetical protein